MINDKIKPFVIPPDFTLLQAMRRMDEIDKKLLFIMKGNKFLSLISIGDIQRAIIKNIDLQEKVVSVTRKNIRVGHVNQPLEEIKQMMIDHRIVAMPLLNDTKELADVLFWQDLFETHKAPVRHNNLNLPVVIMAGGFGERLRPVTNIIPKALIPLGEKTILEWIIGNFMEVGCSDFHLSVNYKADFIKYYFDQLRDKPYTINYFEENKPLGTAGSLSLLKGKINSPFFVSNCDILIEQDLSEIYQYHIESKNELTAVAAIMHYEIPYGTLITKENGKLIEITEKPEFTFKINSGIYILQPHLLEEIPENTFFHITELMDRLCKTGRNIGVFPVSENSWNDIGTWTKFIKASNLKL